MEDIKYHLNTYTEYSHKHAIAILSSSGDKYTFEYLKNEEIYSRVLIVSDLKTYDIIKELTQENNGTAIAIGYGSY